MRGARQVWGPVSWLQIRKIKQRAILALLSADTVPILACDTGGWCGERETLSLSGNSTERPLQSSCRLRPRHLDTPLTFLCPLYGIREATTHGQPHLTGGSRRRASSRWRVWLGYLRTATVDI